jgi:hypothetical protein
MQHAQFIWKAWNTVGVSRYLCGSCGYIEEWIDSADDIARVKADEPVILGAPDHLQLLLFRRPSTDEQARFPRRDLSCLGHSTPPRKAEIPAPRGRAAT